MYTDGIIVVAGEVLLDIFPKYKRIGGAPLNVAFHLNALNDPVRLISRVGKDEEGEEILLFMKRNGMDTSYVQVDSQYPTGRVEVKFIEGGEPHFTIEKGMAYHRLEFENPVLKLLKKNIRLIYFGTLIQWTGKGFEFIRRMNRDASDGTLKFCDLNLRPGCYNREIVDLSLMESDIVKLNQGEFEVLYTWFGNGVGEQSFENQLMDKYNIRMLCITQGAEGSRIITPERTVSLPAPEVSGFRDSVGAGDAYAAAVIHGIFRGYPLDRIIRDAGDLAAEICMLEGAVPERGDFYRLRRNER